MSRTDLGAQIGRSAEAVRSYETEAVVPPSDVVGEIVHALDCTFDDLFVA